MVTAPGSCLPHCDDLVDVELRSPMSSLAKESKRLGPRSRGFNIFFGIVYFSHHLLVFSTNPSQHFPKLVQNVLKVGSFSKSWFKMCPKLVHFLKVGSFSKSWYEMCQNQVNNYISNSFSVQL